MQPQLDPDAQLRVDTLTTIFSPRSIAVVGASDTVAKIGGIPVDFQKRFGYAGAIYPVNPRPGLIQALPAFPSISAIGAPVDLAIFAIPQNLVRAALEDAISAGVRGVVLFTSGFAEVSPQGAMAQQPPRKRRCGNSGREWSRSSHHSHTLPCMSKKPQRLAFRCCLTTCAYSPVRAPEYTAYLLNSLASSPKQ